MRSAEECAAGLVIFLLPAAGVRPVAEYFKAVWHEAEPSATAVRKPELRKLSPDFSLDFRSRFVGLAGPLVMLVAQKSTRIAINCLFLLGFTSMTLFSTSLRPAPHQVNEASAFPPIANAGDWPEKPTPSSS
jgi:hypothetical protein